MHRELLRILEEDTETLDMEELPQWRERGKFVSVAVSAPYRFAKYPTSSLSSDYEDSASSLSDVQMENESGGDDRKMNMNVNSDEFWGRGSIQMITPTPSTSITTPTPSSSAPLPSSVRKVGVRHQECEGNRKVERKDGGTAVAMGIRSRDVSLILGGGCVPCTQVIAEEAEHEWDIEKGESAAECYAN